MGRAEAGRKMGQSQSGELLPAVGCSGSGGRRGFRQYAFGTRDRCPDNSSLRRLRQRSVHPSCRAAASDAGESTSQWAQAMVSGIRLRLFFSMLRSPGRSSHPPQSLGESARGSIPSPRRQRAGTSGRFVLIRWLRRRGNLGIAVGVLEGGSKLVNGIPKRFISPA